MRKLNKTAACGILAAALAAGTLSGCSKAIDGTKTVATVGDEKVTLGLASYMIRDQQAQTMSYYNMLMSQYGVSGSASNVWDQKGDDGKTVGESSKDSVMKTINQLYVLKAHAADYDVTITEDEEKAIKEGNIITGIGLGGEFEFAHLIIKTLLDEESANEVFNKIQY